MKVPVITLAAAALVVVALPARAQGTSPSCADPAIVGAGGEGGDACQKAVDIYRYMNVQLGTLLAGGNATLGQGGTLGGLGHFRVEVRANAMQLSLPDVATTGITLGPPNKSDFTTNDKWAALPVADAAIGIFRGFPLGLTHVGGIDALVNVAYLPEFDSHSVSVNTPDGSLKWGFGARVGILEETALTPGVSFTYFRRDLPSATITATASSTRSVSMEDFDLHTTAWRVVASKSFMIVGLAAGIGQDKYDATANLTYDVDGTRPSKPLALGVTPKRTNMFADVTLNILLLKIVGEIGRVSGGDVSTYNTFDKKATDPRTYGSIGIRLGL
jgi:hypothetical protein